MIRDLLSRLCAGQRTPKWLNLPLLIAMLMPLYAHAAALPDGAPDYEFSVDNVTYKCYFEKEEGSYKYYNVYALPENTSINHASIRLGWYRDLKNYVPADESGCTPISMNTRLVDGVWKDCASLKWIELIVNYWDDSDKDKNSTVNLSPIYNCQSMKYIFVTEGNYVVGAVWYTMEGYNSKHEIYSDIRSLYYRYYVWGKEYTEEIDAPDIGEFAKSLLKQDSFDINMDVCSETDMTPKVEVKPNHLPNDAKYYTLMFDNDGRPVVPLIGDFKYNVSVKELVGKYDAYTGDGGYVGSRHVGSDIFKNCFDEKERVAYCILTPNETNIGQYGYTSIRVTDTSYFHPKEIEKVSDGTYLLSPGSYYIYFTYDGMEMRYTYEVPRSDLSHNMIALSVDKWQPHCVTVTAIEIDETDIFNLEDGAVLGIGAYDDNNELSFAPFDAQKKAVLYDSENSFGTVCSNLSGEYTNGSIDLKFRETVYPVIRVKGRNIVLSNELLKTEPEAQYVNCSVNRDKQRIRFSFRNLYSKGILSQTDKVGVICDGKKYYANDGSTSLYVEDLLPNIRYNITVFYEIDGKQFTSHDVLPIYTDDISYKYKMNASTQSVAFNFSDVSCDESYGDVVFEDLAVYLDGKTRYDDAEFEITAPKDIRISNLQIWKNYELRGNCRYSRKSDGAKTTLFSIKILFKTEEPTWIAGNAQAMTTTKARLTYTTNLENVSETYVEWRRVDAPDVVKSTVAACPVVDGQLVGVLNNLNPDVYYKFRPVFDLNGTPIYGEWIGIFTGDANVWFDPEISTRPARVRKDGSVTLQGSVVPGSGDISEQGFEVWPNGGAQHAPGSGEESSHTFITCNGISISTELTDLKHGVTYTYRAYAKVDGQMYTGSEETFTIPGESGIDDVLGDAEAPTIIGYYNLQGHHSDRPFRGMNIVVYSNGKTEKRIIRE